MMRRKYILGLLIPLLAQFSNAQENNIYKTYYPTYKKGIHLFENKHYELAQAVFEENKLDDSNTELQSNSAYYSAKCGMYLGQSNADYKLKEFINNFPTSSKVVAANFDLSTYYFNKNQYLNSYTYAQKVNTNLLSFKDLNRFYFQEGYAAYITDKSSIAKNAFAKVAKGTTFYKQAQYYTGYIYYKENNYRKAKQYFSEVSSVKKFKDRIGYFKADMYFKTADFDKAIEEGLKQMPKATAAERSDLSKIIGESYFNLKQYNNALPYLLDYEGKNGKLSNTDYYQLGYVYHQLGDYDRAVNYLSKIISGNDAIAQNAYYHLGESYLKSNKKSQAFHAFKNASEMDFNYQLKEYAYSNYAKLSYEIGNPYENVSEVLHNFLEYYPKSVHNPEIEDLLVDSYIKNKDFKKAIEILDRNKSILNQPIYQKVLFYRGIEEYNQQNYSSAIQLFDQSLKKRGTQEFIARSTYWKAESEFAKGNYRQAISDIENFENLSSINRIPEYKNLNYFKGYAYLKGENYPKAEYNFQKFINNSQDQDKKVDAHTRLADVSFLQGKYNQAINSYQKVNQLNPNLRDYTTLQKALCYGLNGNRTKKVELLKGYANQFPYSSHAPVALYELGKTYNELGQNQESVYTFNTLINKYPKSSFKAKAMLNQGLIYYNTNQKSKAIEVFKRVANDFPSTEEAMQAVQNTRTACNETGRTVEFASWVKTLNFVEISTAELETDIFQIATKHKSEGNMQLAIQTFKDYLNQYPNGSYSANSHYHLADLQFKNNPNQAVNHLKKVIEKPSNEFTEQSLLLLSRHSLDTKNQSAAKKYLSLLRDSAHSTSNKQFALANLMKIAYDNKDLNTAQAYAKTLLSMGAQNKIILTDVYVILGRVNFKNKNYTESEKMFNKLSQVANGEAAAEALYYKAWFKNRANEFDSSNKAIQLIAKNYAQHQYFGAKSLILMAKNYYAKKDVYQATYILKSILQNFSEYKDVATEAQNLLNIYKREESKTNSSINQTLNYEK